MFWQELGMVVLWLVVGSALRYILPYVIHGLVAVGEGQKWPKWEWKYLSSFALAIIGFGISLSTQLDFYASLSAEFPIAVIAMAYAGNGMGREVVKGLERLNVALVARRNGD